MILKSIEINFNSILKEPAAQNGQTLKKIVAKTDELFECVWPFCGVGT